jgi:hypothetical protein
MAARVCPTFEVAEGAHDLENDIQRLHDHDCILDGGKAPPPSVRISGCLDHHSIGEGICQFLDELCQQSAVDGQHPDDVSATNICARHIRDAGIACTQITELVLDNFFLALGELAVWFFCAKKRDPALYEC